MADAPASLYRFARFRLDIRNRELREGDGPPIALTAKAFDTLCVLVENRHRVMSKDELLGAVWPGRVVEENNLSQAISALRRALGTDTSDHRYLVTIPGRGYQFVADVLEGDAVTPAETLPAASDAATRAGVLPSHAIAPGPRRAVALGALLFAVALFAVAAWRLRDPPPVTGPARATSRTTLAVLPFRSLGTGPRDEGLELGLADTLITRLSRSNALQVRALASAERSFRPQPDAVAAGRELGAAYVVEGTTPRAGDKVRINARLVSVAKGNTVWAETFDARIDRVFTVQDKLGDAVTSALALAPVVMPTRVQSPCDGQDALAYRAYLRGYYQLNRPDPRRLTDALAAFREAIDRDPTCARAWAGTAYAYRALVITGDRDPRELFPLAKAAVERALAIHPDLAEAHSAKGFIEFWYDWDWPRSEASLRHAIALNPNLAEAQLALAHLLVNIGRPGEALPYARRAVALDPLSPIVNSLASSFMRSAGSREEAARHLDRTLELEPEAWVALRVRGGRALARGDTAQALRDWKRAVEISGGNSNTFAALAKAYMRAGDRAAAERVLAELEARRRAGYVPATSLAVAASALGDIPRVLDLLEQGYEERDVRMSFLLIEWPELRGEPRYLALLKRMRLPMPQAKPTGKLASGMPGGAGQKLRVSVSAKVRGAP
jgi:TolB-like protein/DNA-binding winged helix-turn-helix (wHTH) protein/Flp pilus assembly protein TadD